MSSEVPESPSTGVITTHCVSSAILPGRRSANDPLQFVKIQAADLSIKVSLVSFLSHLVRHDKSSLVRHETSYVVIASISYFGLISSVSWPDNS